MQARRALGRIEGGSAGAQFRERAPAMLKAIPPAINTMLMPGETRSL